MEAFVRAQVERELQEVVSGVDDYRKLPASARKRVHYSEANEFSQDDLEPLNAADVTLMVPTELAELSADDFRKLLKAGWSKLSAAEKSRLSSEHLPEGIKAATLLEGKVQGQFGEPVSQFHRRFALGLYHPAIVQHTRQMPQLAQLVSKLQTEQLSMEAANLKDSWTLMQWFLAATEPGAGDESAASFALLVDEEAESAESVYTQAPASSRPASRPSAVRAARRRRIESEVPQGIALDTTHTNLTRQQKKVQSRIMDGQFMAAFHTFPRVREILRKAPCALGDLVLALAIDPVLVNDPIPGMQPLELARLSIKFLLHRTDCHKVFFGPYVHLVDGRLQWVDDSQYDNLDMFLDLESAERLFRYALSREIIDREGNVSTLHIKELKNNPVTVREPGPEALRDFHRQERERFDSEQTVNAYQYRLPAGSFFVAPQRGKMTKTVRRHPMLLDDRPASVTLQDVVRDALARLPQGVGTKGDLALIIQESQFVDPKADFNVISQAISDCLDRLSAVSDPAAAFHGPSRLWCYLHRSRKEEEFLYDE